MTDIRFVATKVLQQKRKKKWYDFISVQPYYWKSSVDSPKPVASFVWDIFRCLWIFSWANVVNRWTLATFRERVIVTSLHTKVCLRPDRCLLTATCVLFLICLVTWLTNVLGLFVFIHPAFHQCFDKNLSRVHPINC